MTLAEQVAYILLILLSIVAIIAILTGPRSGPLAVSIFAVILIAFVLVFDQ